MSPPSAACNYSSGEKSVQPHPDTSPATQTAPKWLAPTGAALAPRGSAVFFCNGRAVGEGLREAVQLGDWGSICGQGRGEYSGG